MHLLVIEDNPDLVANIYDFFEAKGHAVDAAYDALTGMKFALAQDYDAVILDLMLPGGDGLDLCSRLRDAGYEVPIIMLTARDTVEDRLEGFAAGTDDYLIKPFSLQELAARIEALVRRYRRINVRRRLQVADLAYDPDTLRVTRGERVVELPPIPLKIFDVLVRQSPRVVRREEIERAVWGDSPPDSDALRAHVHLLRAAIDGGETRPLLRTVRGVGYQLADPDAD
jgi:DNA-binding response OmpR family regulator